MTIENLVRALGRHTRDTGKDGEPRPVEPAAPMTEAPQTEGAKSAAPKPEAPLTAADIRALKAQIIATFIDMPRCCAVKRCRRQGRCRGAGAPCLRRHWGLVQERLTDLAWEKP